MDNFCTACHYDGSLTRLACPTCGKFKWYCSDCHVGFRAYNCGECQAPPEANTCCDHSAQPQICECECHSPPLGLIPCPLCKAGMCGDPEEIKAGLLMICDGCNSEKFDKKSEPGMPGLFYPYRATNCMCGQDCGDLRN
jgi:hypothetical protein